MRGLAGRPGRVVAGPREARPPGVEVRSLGGFEVLVDGRSVPLAAWRSRKARDVLKLLVAARGRRVAREHLLETLWPDEDPERSGPRLSVALSTVRGVLDRSKQQPADHYLAADRSSVWLRREHLTVDLERFLERAAEGLEAASRRRPEAQQVLVEAEALYRGDFLAEDLYEDWAVGTREEARNVYQRTASALARLAVDAGEHEAAAGYLWRLIERDPWDEAAHLELVRVLAASGRQGEARRAYRRYVSRMSELGVESAPFPVPEQRGSGVPPRVGTTS